MQATGLRPHGTDTAFPLEVPRLVAALEVDPFPVESLKALLGSVRVAQARATGMFGGPGDPAADPGPVASFLAEQIEDAGLLRLPDDCPVRLHRHRRAGQVRLDVQGALPDLDDLPTVRCVESALNRAVYAGRCVAQRPQSTVGELYLLADAIEQSVVEEAASLDLAAAAFADRGEWEVRRAVAVGLDSLRLPYRLQAGFRLNLSAGVAAVSFEAADPRVMAPRVWDGQGSTRLADEGKRRARAARLTCREALLMALLVLSTSPRLQSVWVEATGPDGETLLSWKARRRDLAGLDLGDDARPVGRLASLGARVMWDGTGLSPVEAAFSLDDPVLCPAWRSEAPESSERPLVGEAASALGATDLAGLAIRGTDRRRRAADRACAGLDGVCEHDVRSVLEATAHDGDPAVREAGRRVAAALVEGTLDGSDPAAVRRALEGDGEFGDAVRRAFETLSSGAASDPAVLERHVERLSLLVADEEARWGFQTGGDVTWRYFNSYAERSLHNRLAGPDPAPVALVPAPYYHAHGALASLSMRLGRADLALGWALGAVELDPMDVNARLRVARCYELMGDAPMAEATVVELLSIAHDPESICAAYLRLGVALRAQGELVLADACLRHAVRMGGACAPTAATALDDMRERGGYEPVSASAVADALEAARIPLAPVEAVGDALVSGARAAVDAGIFPVARDLTALVGVLTRDESLLTVALSMEVRA